MGVTASTASEIEPGRHLGVPFAEYLGWPIWNQSALKEMRLSPLHAKSAFDRETGMVPTDPMTLGSALHMCFLEPERMLERVVMWDYGRRYGSKWDAFCAEHDGRIILTRGMHENLCGMVASLRRHPVVREWSASIEHTEVSIVGDVHGLRMKARIDALTSEPLIDLKSCRSAGYEEMQRAVLSFGYHIQGAVYRELARRERWVLICVENTPPYDVCAYEATEETLAYGATVAKQLIEQVRECTESGQWPGRSDEIAPLHLPEWIPTGPAPTLGGEEMFPGKGKGRSEWNVDLLDAP